MGKGSGSVTAFSRADGFVRIGRNVEIVEEGARVEVTRIGAGTEVADLVIIGSHCAGLDVIASALARGGLRVKLLAVGSLAGLAAVAARRVRRGAHPPARPRDAQLQHAVSRRVAAPAARATCACRAS